MGNTFKQREYRNVPKTKTKTKKGENNRETERERERETPFSQVAEKFRTKNDVLFDRWWCSGARAQTIPFGIIIIIIIIRRRKNEARGIPFFWNQQSNYYR